MKKYLYDSTDLWYNSSSTEEIIMDDKKNIAVTGSCGFIGKHLTDRLIESGKNVIEWDLRTEPPTDVSHFKTYNIDYVVHLAAYANVRQSIKDPEKYWKNNVELTKNIQDICYHSHIPLLYASSSCIHNWWLSPYGTTKKVNEITAHKEQVALRFTTVYGEGARDNMFIPKLLNHEVKYVTNHVRDFIYVGDVVDAIILLMSKDIRLLQSSYDIGTGIGNTVSELAALAGYTDLPIKDGESCEAIDNTADNSELRSLGWEPKINVQDYIIKKTIPH